MVLIPSTELFLFILIAIPAGIASEWLITRYDPSFRESEVGQSLDSHPILRYIYNGIYLVLMGTELVPVLDTVGLLISMSLFIGFSLVGWDMFLCWFAHRIQSAGEKASEAAEEAREKKEEAQKELKDTPKVKETEE